jgi:hypothetical protein
MCISMVRNKTVLLKIPVLKQTDSSQLHSNVKIECMHENATCWCSSVDFLTWPMLLVVATRASVMSHSTRENLLQYKLTHVHCAKKSTRVQVSPFVQFCSRSMTRMTCWRSMWRSSCCLNTEQAEPSTNRLQSKILLPMGEYWVLYNKGTLSPQLWSQKFRPWSISAGGTPTSVLLYDGCDRMCTQTEFSDVLYRRVRGNPL